MKIAIIDADLIGRPKHRFPNLTCMKLSGYYKKNNNVNLIYDYKDLYIDGNIWIEYQNALSKYVKEQNEENNKILSEKMIVCFKKENFKYDKIFISKVFVDTEIDKDFLNLDFDLVEYGGTGFFYDKAEPLSYEIEHHMPDYHLYDEWINKQLGKGRKRKEFEYYLDYSIGFTTRGCFRQCDFCVNKNYTKVETHSPIEEFLDNNRKYICLLDDNILGYWQWESILDNLIKTNKGFQYKQGMDMRLMTDKRAEKLAKCKYIGDFIFAFDHIKDKDEIQIKIKLWKKYNKKTTKFYTLCAYDSQDINDIINTFERIKILMQHGCLPYIMRFKDYLNSEYKGMYINLAAWCNQPNFFKKKSFREWCIADAERKSSKMCSTLKYMQQFESKHPEVAKLYFDLKFEDLNTYNNTIYSSENKCKILHIVS